MTSPWGKKYSGSGDTVLVLMLPPHVMERLILELRRTVVSLYYYILLVILCRVAERISGRERVTPSNENQHLWGLMHQVYCCEFRTCDGRLSERDGKLVNAHLHSLRNTMSYYNALYSRMTKFITKKQSRGCHTPVKKTIFFEPPSNICLSSTHFPVGNHRKIDLTIE